MKEMNVMRKQCSPIHLTIIIKFFFKDNGKHISSTNLTNAYFYAVTFHVFIYLKVSC